MGLANLIPGVSSLDDILLQIPLTPQDPNATSQQALAGKSALLSGQVGRDVAINNFGDLLKVAQRSHFVANELDNFRKHVERYVLGSDVKTYEPAVVNGADRITPFHTRVNVVASPSMPVSTYTPEHPLFKSEICNHSATLSAFILSPSVHKRRMKRSCLIQDFL